MRELCRHCQERIVSRARGLCWRCYYTPGVPELYPLAYSKYHQNGVPDRGNRLPLPPEPTQAMPGSPEKVAVLAARAGVYQLWHPQDAVQEKETRGERVEWVEEEDDD